MRNQEYSPALLILVSFCLTFFVTKLKETVRFKQLNCCQISSNGPGKKGKFVFKYLEKFGIISLSIFSTRYKVVSILHNNRLK